MIGVSQNCFRLTRKSLSVPSALGWVFFLGWLMLVEPMLGQITVEDLLARVAERARQQTNTLPQQEFIRTKTTMRLDKQNRVKEREELTYHMVIIDGTLYPRLIRKNGQALSPKEQQQEEENEAAFRESQGEKQQERNTVLKRLGEDTAKRFNYSIVGRERINDRSAYVVAVTPRPGLPAKTKEEQVMARTSGYLWVDELEYEIAKVDMRLMKPLSFGMGLLGALNEFQIYISRSRAQGGQWENSNVNVGLQFRILVETTRIRYEEKVSPLPFGL